MTENEKVLPTYKVKVSSIDGAVFEREVTDKEGRVSLMYNVSLSKNYKDSKGDWAKTNSLNVADIPNAIIVLQKCYEFVKVSVDEVVKKE